MKPCVLAIALALAAPAIAQPTDQVGSDACSAAEAALERDINLAGSRGQMLRRHQLVEALAALQTRKTLAREQSGAARIEGLEQKIRELRLELDRAEEQLRELKQEGS